MTQIIYPIRINKYLSQKGYCGRREADGFIKSGLVKINGKVATLGQKVLETDKVEVSNKLKVKSENYKYLAFNKKSGVSTEDVIIDDLLPIGRLDKDSEGLLLLSNDRRIVKYVLDPKYDHEKEYIVTVDKNVKDSFIRKMTKGVDIEGYLTKPAKVSKKDENKFSIIITEGKKHQIRRMCAALGYQVRKLKRVRIMHISLKNLKPGMSRDLTATEKEVLLSKLV